MCSRRSERVSDYAGFTVFERLILENQIIFINCFFQVPLKKAMLDSSDVFILDLGLKIFQYNGASCNKDEKYRAVQYLQDLKSKRPKALTETLEEDELVRFYFN